MAGREPGPEEFAAADIVAGALGGGWELDGTQPSAELVVATRPPPPAPDIPPEIDIVWLATPPLGTPAKLWRARQAAGWEVLR